MKLSRHWKTGAAAAALLAAGMGAAAAATEVSACVFPEGLARAMGCLWLYRRPWRTDRPRMFACILAAALCGLALSTLRVRAGRRSCGHPAASQHGSPSGGF